MSRKYKSCDVAFELTADDKGAGARDTGISMCSMGTLFQKETASCTF